MSAILHYIYDPLCGWCYGAEPLVTAAASTAGIELRLHAGGLWPEPTTLPDGTRRYIQQADARIASMSGQPFGPAYLSGLLLDPNMVLYSLPPIAAILAAQSIVPEKALPMLRAIQRAHYVEGRRVVEHTVLCDIAVECGLERKEFEAALRKAPAERHIGETRQLMHRVGSGGFPTFVLEKDGRLGAVPHQRYASDAAGFGHWLASELKAGPPLRREA
ncbi:MAG TPA: DsbA family protein [Gammaproteobacteria bacterium]